MPRAGQRPYECVRRAWHSDRHQPMRGSLIQEIFRIVNEIHSCKTKKNKEWQVKLPTVVLKAEEIMYSKANTEAEYVDVNSLWDRVNDAIDTIIRKDETTETGKLLQPCIEAALHLGCTPKRSSRSQRNISPTYYLNPETNSMSHGNLHDRIRGNPTSNTSFLSLDHKLTSAAATNSHTESQNKFHFSTPTPPIDFQPLRMPTCGSTNSFSVYPLFYGCPFDPSDPKFDENIAQENTSLCELEASNHNFRADCECISEDQPVIECDLSLRLGSPSVPCTRPGDVSKSDYLRPQLKKGLTFFLQANVEDHQFASSSRKTSFISPRLNGEVVQKKRKLFEDRQFCWPVKPPFNKFRS